MNSSIQLSFICFSVNNWEKRMARKQQLMLYLSKKPAIGNVVYVEPPVNLLQPLFFPFSTLNSPEKRKRWKRALLFSLDPVAEKLYLYTPLYYLPFSYRFQPVYNINLFLSSLILKRRVKQLNLRRTVIWLYHPFDYSVLRWFRARITSVFDWAEEWADYFIEFSPAKRKKIAEQEEDIVQKVDVVFTVSKALYDKARAWNDNTYQLFDGTAAELFLSAEAGLPVEIQTIAKPVIGYIGTIMERFDDGLIASLSEELPYASIVLIGDVHRHRIDISALEKRNNVFFLGGNTTGSCLPTSTTSTSVSCRTKKAPLFHHPQKSSIILRRGNPLSRFLFLNMNASASILLLPGIKLSLSRGLRTPLPSNPHRCATKGSRMP
jgi:hypothetical protein